MATSELLLGHEFVEGASKYTWLGQCMFRGCGQNRADHYAAEPAAPSADLALIEEVEALISDVRYIGSIVQHSTLSSLLALAHEALAGREDTARLTRIGGILPVMLKALPWGAFKGALLEDDDIEAAIRAARSAAGEK